MNWNAFWSVIAVGGGALALTGLIVAYIHYAVERGWSGAIAIGIPFAAIILAAAVFAGAIA